MGNKGNANPLWGPGAKVGKGGCKSGEYPGAKVGKEGVQICQSQ